MAETTVTTTAGKEVAATPGTREESRFLTPPVDIYETPDGLIVVADLPGVEKENLQIRIENGILTIKAHPADGLPGSAIYNEFSLLDYFRQFELPAEVDQEKIAANLKNGVLTLHLPKAEAAKPRQISVHVA